MVNGARSIAEKHGMDKLQPYRTYLEDLKQNAKASEVKAAAAATIDAMEKRRYLKSVSISQFLSIAPENVFF